MKLTSVAGFVSGLMLTPFICSLISPGPMPSSQELAVDGATLQLIGPWAMGRSEAGRWKLADAYATRRNHDGSRQGAVAIRVFRNASEFDHWTSEVRCRMEPTLTEPGGIELDGRKCDIIRAQNLANGHSVRYMVTFCQHESRYCIHFAGDSRVVDESLDLLKRGWSWKLSSLQHDARQNP